MARKPVRVTPEMVEAALREVDWTAQDALTDADIDAQIAADPDVAPEATDAEIAAMRVQQVRRSTGLSQPAFAEAFRIPVGTLRDWEQGRREPDAAALAYLTVIEREPEVVRRALAPKVA